MNSSTSFSVAILTTLAFLPPAPSGTQVTGALGKHIADFTLRDSRGQAHSLADVADKKLVVVVFLGTDCPLAKRYGPRVAELAREFAPRGVAFLGINANAQDTMADVAAFVRSSKVPFAVLKDPDQVVADRFGAERTAEAFVLDEKRVVRYWGRIDDQYGIGVGRRQPVRRDLAEALNELLTGKPVARPLVPSAGCRIGRLPKVQPHGPVTYTRHIAAVVQKRCLECHRSGEVGPFPLTTYQDVVGWSAMIREVVNEGRMPPWFADSKFGHFRNDARLTPEEKRQLLTWIDNGCPQGGGELADLQPAPTLPRGWRISQPELVVFMAPKPHQVPAEGEAAYEYFLVDPGFTEDKFLQAAEVRPGNRAVVHHALVSIVPPGAGANDLGSTGALLDYAPGMAPTVLPPGLAVHVPAGSKFLFQMHYTPNGTPQSDRSYLGLVFAPPHTVKQKVRGGAVVNQAIEIPPGAAAHRETASLQLAQDVRLLSLSPHLHLRGKSFRFEAHFPDGRREILLDVPRYDFNWQLRYDLAEPKALPRGTRLVCNAYYDNSPSNPANPDATKRVVWGDQTWEEMLIGFFAFVEE
jgi:peroxiredoxin